ncbi:MAG TPA: galactokinase [Chthoniobacterales bacterium]|nr:galactokinase [Chthoniobacterales bacterium]
MTGKDQRVSGFAPGRVELLGNHTDYNEGVVLGGAIDRGLTVSGHPRDDGMITIQSSTMGRVVVPLSQLQPQSGDARWSNYGLGVASQLIERGIRVPAFSAEVDGDLPAGNGLSSSAAFEVATGFFLQKLCHAEVAPLEMAKMCQRAEARFAGVQSGLLDQITSIFGKADHAVFFDARTEEVRTIPFPKHLALIVAQTGAPRELAAGQYNERREETRAAAEGLGVRSLRDMSSAGLAAHQDLAPLLRRRAAHVVGENERVWRSLEFLERGDGAGFGALMNESHESSRTNFENSTDQLDELVAIAKKLPGVLGSRLTGGGFGGATITLCERTHSIEVATSLSAAYAERTGITPPIFVCRLSEGAR